MRLQAFIIDEKRIRLPFTVTAACPLCKTEVVFDARTGIDFPKFGGETRLYALCTNEACENETSGFSVAVVLEATVILAPSSPAYARVEHAQMRR